MAVHSFFTVSEPTTGLYKEKGSKFLSFVYPVADEAGIKERLDSLRKEYFDARHHCYAWMLGPDKKRYRAADDGEPNHSAGDPILGQIRAYNVTNVLVVVVRYFGGVKLGVGGLISAYKLAAEDALKKATRIEKEVFEVRTIHHAYEATPEVMRLIKEYSLIIVRQHFDEVCVINVEVPLRVLDGLIAKVDLLKAMGSSINL